VRHIDGFAQLLGSDFAGVLGAEGQTLVQRIRSGTRHMNQLINGLLSLARMARLEIRIEPVDISALADAAAETLRRAEPDRPVEFEIDQGLRARGDEALLRVVLDNLIGNAWKFTAGRTPARIEVRKNGENGTTGFVVADNGAGFDMAYADKLFGVFQRLHSQDEFQGIGVGLATVQRIIHRHGGHIRADAKPGQGAKFSVTLPA
jgi:light-regulated signal transduction histidine kinase (bacteriophytochrome)